MHPSPIVIDGPAGAGKSTVARRLAERLGGTYLDTGAMYRAFTLRALRQGVDLQDPRALTRVVAEGELQLVPDAGGLQVRLDGEDVTAAIRTPEVTRAIHFIAGCAEVRELLVEEQRRLAESGETVRVYVPYGREWYGYLMRRLAERPQNLSFFLKSLISKK